MLGQVSQFVTPGAYRIGSTFGTGGPSCDGGENAKLDGDAEDASDQASAEGKVLNSCTLWSVAFHDPDGEDVLLVLNTASSGEQFDVAWNGQYFARPIPPKSVQTFVWQTAAPSPPPSAPAPTPTPAPVPTPAPAPAAQIVFDGSPGVSPPPTTLGPYTMQGFPTDPTEEGTDVTSVDGPTGQITFDQQLQHDLVGGYWQTWSNGYTGDVYEDDAALADGTSYEITITLPPNTGAFYLYAEPDIFEDFDMTATAQDGTTSGDESVYGNSGAQYFGFWTTCGNSLSAIQVTDTGGDQAMAMGEFGIAPACPGPGGAVPNPTVAVYTQGSGNGTVTGASINCPGTCSASYPPGTQVTLTATPDDDSTFDGWGGACSGTGPCTLTVGESQAVTALFDDNS